MVPFQSKDVGRAFLAHGGQKKSFWPWIFPVVVVPFQSKEVGLFFGSWTTAPENRSSVLCDAISGFHSRVKQAQTER